MVHRVTDTTVIRVLRQYPDRPGYLDGILTTLSPNQDDPAGTAISFGGLVHEYRLATPEEVELRASWDRYGPLHLPVVRVIAQYPDKPGPLDGVIGLLSTVRRTDGHYVSGAKVHQVGPTTAAEAAEFRADYKAEWDSPPVPDLPVGTRVRTFGEPGDFTAFGREGTIVGVLDGGHRPYVVKVQHNETRWLSAGFNRDEFEVLPAVA